MTPFRVAALAFLLACGVTLVRGLLACDGALAYAVDDAYIHLAMARSLAEHGVYGATPHAFTASSSSPLWTLLLAALAWPVGTWLWWPLLLNVAAGLGVLTVADRMLRGASGPRARTTALLLLIVLAPLPAVAFTGMEHLLHALLVLLLARTLLGDRPAVVTAALLAALATATRLESAFAIAPLAGIAWLQGHRRAAAAAALAGAAALAATALWSLLHGWFWLPTSVALKSSLQHGGVPGLKSHAGIWQMLTHEHLTAVLGLGTALVAWARARRVPWRDPAVAGALAMLVALLLHGAFARFGWFYRYEAWLMVWATVALALLAARVRAAGGGGGTWPLVTLLVVAAGLALPRGLRALRDPPAAMRHTWVQPCFVGRFLAANFPGVPVALNDLGAVAFYAAPPVTDLVGLADLDVARARLEGRCDAAFLGDLCARRGVRLAVVYADWFAGALPPSWQAVGSWTVQDDFWGETVTWYAVDPAETDRLRELVAAPPGGLPEGVVRSVPD